MTPSVGLPTILPPVAAVWKCGTVAVVVVCTAVSQPTPAWQPSLSQPGRNLGQAAQGREVECYSD